MQATRKDWCEKLLKQQGAKDGFDVGYDQIRVSDGNNNDNKASRPTGSREHCSSGEDAWQEEAAARDRWLLQHQMSCLNPFGPTDGLDAAVPDKVCFLPRPAPPTCDSGIRHGFDVKASGTGAWSGRPVYRLRVSPTYYNPPYHQRQHQRQHQHQHQHQRQHTRHAYDIDDDDNDNDTADDDTADDDTADDIMECGRIENIWMNVRLRS
jgi:hypothetical protein